MRTKEQYLKEINRVGRIGVLITLILLFAVPTIFGIYHDAMPNFKDFITAGSGILVTFTIIGIIEVFSYTPLLGSAAYITFITGNIMNLKVPIANNAQDIADTTKGTEKSDVITMLAIGVSAMVTIIMIAIGVLLLVPLEPFMTSTPVQTATSYVLPALFGALIIGVLASRGDVIVKNKVYAGAPVFLLILIVNLVVMSTVAESGVLLLVTIPLTIASAYFLFKKNIITIEVRESKEEE